MCFSLSLEVFDKHLWNHKGFSLETLGLLPTIYRRDFKMEVVSVDPFLAGQSCY